jgi:hypothetical protein
MRLTAESYDGVFPDSMQAFNFGAGAKKFGNARTATDIWSAD